MNFWERVEAYIVLIICILFIYASIRYIRYDALKQEYSEIELAYYKCMLFRNIKESRL